MPSPSIAQKQKLYQRYLQLAEDRRFLAQIFALLYEPASRDNARRCWVVAMAKQKRLTKVATPVPKTFNAQVSELIGLGVLTQERGRGTCCNPVVIDLVVRDAVKMETFEPIVEAIAQLFPIGQRYPNGSLFFRNEAQFMREVRIALYREDRAAAAALFKAADSAYWQATLTFDQALCDILTNPPDVTWIDRLSDEFFELGLNAILTNSVEHCAPADEAFDLLIDYCENGQVGPSLHLLYAEQLWLRGHLDTAVDVLANLTVDKPLAARSGALMGAIAFLLGDSAGAIAHYQTALKAAGKSQQAQLEWLSLPAATMFFFVLLENGSADALKEAERLALLIQKQTGQKQATHPLKPGIPLLLAVLQQQQGVLTNAAKRFSHHRLNEVGLPALLQIYSLYWLNIDDIADWVAQWLPRLCQLTLKAGYGWIALETAELLVNYQPRSPFVQVVEGLREQTDSLPLITIVERKEAWELSLDALTALAAKPDTSNSSSPTPQPQFRMAWRLSFHSIDNWSLTPVEQKLSIKGGWTKGKKIALQRLYSGHNLPEGMSRQDGKICDAIDAHYNDSYYYRNSPTYYFGTEALIALIDHPLVFWEASPDVRVDIVKGEPELLVKRLESDQLQIELMPPITRADVLVEKETPTRLKVIVVNEQHQRIAAVLGEKNRLTVPLQAEERVLRAIASIANLVTVQSDIGGGVEAEEVPSDATPHAHLLPAGEGLKVSLLAQPFAESGTAYTPGEGGETVITVVDGQRLQTRRDLQQEKQNAAAVIDDCKALLQYEPVDGEWLIDEPTDCLELLMQLQEMGESVVVEWPEGEKFKVSRQLGVNDFKFDIHRQQDWFAASGEVQVSENQVVDLQQLMMLLDNTSGQFVPLADGEFLALTEEFRQRLKTLSRLSQRHGKELRINGLAALAMDEMLDDLEQIKVDTEWQDHIQQIKTAQAIEPEVPKTLLATLRDYQQEGYVWLSRLANWGVGACLADDMGLGKTLQGLAVMLSRASEGPALVIAPTSVCMNWSSEAERFAPSLRVQSLGESDRTHRQDLLDNLGPNDLLVCSYGLVQQEDVAEMLAAVTWQTIVLDEAQAIKNYATKRSQAVMALQGSFKIIMTGTPIENHLGELWNLFRFINSGLLGSLDSFNQRFANPIERDQDDSASDALRRLIRPFILRRTKNQVLKELPSRTEITLPVELSKQEMAFYEALRREAIIKLSDSEAEAGHKHLQVLAEIMKLRRACCNPSLVKPELALPSAKLEQFSELITELLDNGHKALVFSQFVDHLKILRNYLDEQQISYQYLDGSTPTKKRKAGVDAFQAGEGDVFLISLKAGGSGLNLTAADYVIHMDPWWNPAVEDQASDRAHRIGQQRPVTIYRLVAKGTIEDKIVNLHKVKRDLADSLLTGSDMSSKVSTDELLSLIQQ